MTPADSEIDDEGSRRTGIAWVNHISSGTATHEDAEALERWRQESLSNEADFREAARLRRLVRAAAPPSAVYAAIAPIAAPPLLNRRVVLTGAIAASVAGAFVIVRHSASDQVGDFATVKGETRRIALASGIAVELNTETTIARRPDVGIDAIELLRGEAVMTATLARRDPFVVVAGAGRTWAQNARFGLRCDGDEMTVTCLQGMVIVKTVGGGTRLLADQQVRYRPDGIAAVIDVDSNQISAWRRGLLVFQDRPLREVVAEINRYRSGNIILANTSLGQRRISGTLYLKQPDQIIEQVQSSFGARVLRLPGDVVVVS